MTATERSIGKKRRSKNFMQSGPIQLARLALLVPRRLVQAQPDSPAPRALVGGADQASISGSARLRAQETAENERAGDQDSETNDANDANNPSDLPQGERAEVRKLQARDREVRSHEQAHKAAAGDLASGGPSFQYETGPDGHRYAVGGEVQISTREGSTPEETLRNAERVRRAATAPEQPSSQDRRVAAEATQAAQKARTEIQAERDQAGRDTQPSAQDSSESPRTASIDVFA